MSSAIDLGIEHIEDVRQIGSGGFSVVYSARHTLFKRDMAVKLLNPLAKESERLRFERECEVMGRLSNHPNVVSVFNAGYTSDDRPYLLMELVSGGTLQDLVDRRGTLPWREAVAYLLPICSALGAAHDEAILHRDVKPENILLGADGEPRLADFGIASLRDATGATSTHITASMLHTAPETFENQRDERSDLYSLASTLFAVVVGRAPFWHAEDLSIHPLMNRLMNDPAPAIAPDLGPPNLSAFIQRSLAKDPDRRPQTAGDFKRELKLILGGSGALEDHVVDPEPARGPTAGPRPQGFAPPQQQQTPYGQPGAPQRPQVRPSGSRPQPGPGPGGPYARPPAYGQPVPQAFAAPPQQHRRPPQPGPFPSGPAPNPLGVRPGPVPVGQSWAGPGTGPVLYNGPANYSQPVAPGALRLASTNSRCGARAIDWVIWFFIWLFALGTLGNISGSDESTYLEILLTGTFTTLVVVAYEVVCVALMGATVGKLITGLRVVRTDGSSPDFVAASKRMLMFAGLSIAATAMYFPFVIMAVLGGVGFHHINTNPMRQTFWDRHADTIVIGR